MPISLGREALSNLCHDLRSPMTAISGTFSLVELYLDDLPPARRRVLDAGMRALDQMVEMLDDLQTYAALDAPATLLTFAEVSATSLLEEVVHGNLDRARRKEILIRLAACPDALAVDPDLVARACGPVLARAIAVSPEGETVEVGAERHGDRIRIAIRDHGAVLDAGQLAGLFEPFRSAPTAPPGLGLGLAGAVAKAHGGAAWAEAGAEDGTVVVLELPAASIPIEA